MALKREIKDAYIENGDSIYVKTHSNAVYVNEIETETLTQRLYKVRDSITKHTSQLDNIAYINKIADYKIKMINSESVKIDTKGDSTYWGTSASGSQTSRTCAIVLQEMLRGYFNNNLISVENTAVGGHATSDVIDTWDEYLNTTECDVIFINYCLNENYRGVTVEQYKKNLETMVIKTRAKGKEIVFDLPNQNINYTKINKNANMLFSQSTKIYCGVMEEVAKKYDVTIINNYKTLDEHINESIYVDEEFLFDGVHGTDKLYQLKAMEMLKVFTYNKNEGLGNIIPCYSNVFRFYPNSSCVQVKCGLGVVNYGTHITACFDVKEENDILIGLSVEGDKGSSVSKNIEVNFNGEIINIELKGQNLADSGLKEFLLKKKFKGYCCLVIKSKDGLPVGVHYIRKGVKKVESIYSNSENFNSIETPIYGNISKVSFNAFIKDGFTCVISTPLIAGRPKGNYERINEFVQAVGIYCDSNDFYITRTQADSKSLPTLANSSNTKKICDSSNVLNKNVYIEIILNHVDESITVRLDNSEYTLPGSGELRKLTHGYLNFRTNISNNIIDVRNLEIINQ